MEQRRNTSHFIALCQMLNYLNVQGYIYENSKTEILFIMIVKITV